MKKMILLAGFAFAFNAFAADPAPTAGTEAKPEAKSAKKGDKKAKAEKKDAAAPADAAPAAK